MLEVSGVQNDLEQRRAAIAALYETHYEVVVRYIAIRTNNRSRAEDKAIQVFKRALESVKSYSQAAGPMEAWLLRMAQRAATEPLGRRHFRWLLAPLRLVRNLFGRRRIPRIGTEAMEGTYSNGLASAEATAKAGHVRIGLEKLSELQREILVLRLSGLSSAMVANVLGRKLEFVREMQRIAIKKLHDV